MYPYPFDTYRDAFLKFLAAGSSYAEAIQQFDRAEFEAAAMAEFESGELSSSPRATEFVTHEGKMSLFDLAVRASYEERQARDMEEQAIPLYLAGWTSEAAKPPSEGFWGQTQVMSLYWRAPSKRAGRPGRRYLSTQQAFNAMQLAAGK